MNPTRAAVVCAVDAELRDFRFPETLAAFRPLLVAPHRQDRDWEYGSSDARVECWIVAQLRPGLGIAYARVGHGPSSPWGLVETDAADHCGADDRWYAKLEDAFLQSGKWHEALPDDYEVG